MKKNKTEISEFIKKYSEVIAEIVMRGNVAEIDTSMSGVKTMELEKKKVS